MENPFETEKLVRPTFLTVLCILTFIGSGWEFVSNLFSLSTFSTESIVVQIQQITNLGGTQAGTSWLASLMNSSLEVLQTIIRHGKAIYSFAILFSLMSLVGAFLMFRLKKLGFYLYVLAQLAALFVLPFYSGWSMVVVLSILGSGFISLVFIVLYAVNYNKLKC